MFAFQKSSSSTNPKAQKLLSRISPTTNERFFGQDELIVSKTDPGGRITYANDVFLRIAGMSESETIGAPHSVIRHPDMPRAVFKLLWDTLGTGKEIFAYVKNMSVNGDYYWVLAHVTPSYDSAGTLTGYHSNRRVPERSSVATISGLYKQLLDIEKSAGNRKQGMKNAEQALFDILKEKGINYGQFVFSI
ncbi:putative sensor (PAS) domain for methyl-accepting chemotaxis sensory transducer [hydrothermal vent metagenome]|uniref:Putative sensor (PAS) domain for methyl-accepting chemotaxis sensory transducer n=1 Tax=hydrothermal vent metagenome TaxID=652676 RepID=A0A3B0S4L5_9ZZZZ